MKQQLITVLLALISLGCQGQDEEKFNLDFENQKEGSKLPDDWFQWGVINCPLIHKLTREQRPERFLPLMVPTSEALPIKYPQSTKVRAYSLRVT